MNLKNKRYFIIHDFLIRQRIKNELTELLWRRVNEMNNSIVLDNVSKMEFFSKIVKHEDEYINCFKF